MANIEGQVAEKVQRARDEAYALAYDQGVKDAKRSLKKDSFSDLHLAWREVQAAHMRASNYAGIVSSMYNVGSREEALEKKEDK